MKYQEPYKAGNKYRQEYLDSVLRMIDKRKAEAQKNRDEFDKKLVKDPEGFRQKYKEMLGWPLCDMAKNGVPNVREELVTSEDGIDVIKMQIEVMPDFWYYGILFKRKDGKKRPFIISQHGGVGSPEVCSSLLPGGSYNYNEMTQRILKYDVNVFAPQMLLWSQEEYGIDYSRTEIDNILKQAGGSITALEIYSLTRTLDYFEVQPFVDAEQIGMVGMSYGGMYTLYTTAAEPRIKAALSSSFFADRFLDNTRPDWVYFDAGNTFFDAEIAMLIHPRKIYLAMGKSDPLFDYNGSIREYERIKKAFPDYENWTELELFEGVHEFCPSDRLLEKLMSNFNF